MKKHEEKAPNKTVIPGEEPVATPTIEVDGKEFKPFESDGEFWGMLDAIEKQSIRDYEEKQKRGTEQEVSAENAERNE